MGQQQVAGMLPESFILPELGDGDTGKGDAGEVCERVAVDQHRRQGRGHRSDRVAEALGHPVAVPCGAGSRVGRSPGGDDQRVGMVGAGPGPDQEPVLLQAYLLHRLAAPDLHPPLPAAVQQGG